MAILRPRTRTPTWGFWFRYPAALGAEAPTRSQGLERQADDFARYGAELHVLEKDLVDCLSTTSRSCEELITQRSLVQIQPPQPWTTRG